MYQAQSQLFVSVQSAGGISTPIRGVLQRIQSYVPVVETPAVLNPVIKELGLDTDFTQLASQVSVQNPTGTVLLNVLATDVDSAQAARIADATAASLAKEVVRLETTNSGTTPVRVELIRPAQVPSSPVSPRTQLNLVLGALLGLMIGAGIAVLRATLDTSIKSVEDLQQATHTTLLGAIPFDSGAAKHPLVMMDGTSRAEAYRSIRTNLQYVDVDHPPKTVVITSCVPREGKSTTAANLAIALAQGGSRVLLVEADLGRPKVAEYLGVEGSVGLTDVLSGQAQLNDVIVTWQRGAARFPACRGYPAQSQRTSRLPAAGRLAQPAAYPVRHGHPGCTSPAPGHRCRDPGDRRRRRDPGHPIRRDEP